MPKNYISAHLNTQTLVYKLIYLSLSVDCDSDFLYLISLHDVLDCLIVGWMIG